MSSRYLHDCIAAASSLGIVTKEGEALRADAGESLFLERQLESVETRLYQKKLRELRYRQFIPITNVAGPGAAVITYYLYTKVGMAKIIANPSDDLPRSDVYAERHTMNVHNEGTSFGYSTRDLRQAVFAGVPLDSMKADAARRGIHELENTLAWTGDTSHNIVGFLAHPNVPTVQAPLNAGATSRAWIDKTADEIIEDVRLMTSGIRLVKFNDLIHHLVNKIESRKDDKEWWRVYGLGLTGQSEGIIFKNVKWLKKGTSIPAE